MRDEVSIIKCKGPSPNAKCESHTEKFKARGMNFERKRIEAKSKRPNCIRGRKRKRKTKDEGRRTTEKGTTTKDKETKGKRQDRREDDGRRKDKGEVRKR